VETPAQVIGFAPGTDRKLADFGQALFSAILESAVDQTTTTSSPER
jgi:hypothetical protein